MNPSPKRQAPAGYRFRVGGHLDDHWSAWFGDLVLTNDHDGTTSIAGAVSDQAELHGLLSKIRDLGVTLISVEIIDLPDSVAHQPDSLDAAHPQLLMMAILPIIAIMSLTGEWTHRSGLANFTRSRSDRWARSLVRCL